MIDNMTCLQCDTPTMNGICCLICTASQAEAWRRRLQRHLSPGGEVDEKAFNAHFLRVIEEATRLQANAKTGNEIEPFCNKCRVTTVSITACAECQQGLCCCREYTSCRQCARLFCSYHEINPELNEEDLYFELMRTTPCGDNDWCNHGFVKSIMNQLDKNCPPVLKLTHDQITDYFKHAQRTKEGINEKIRDHTKVKEIERDESWIRNLKILLSAKKISIDACEAARYLNMPEFRRMNHVQTLTEKAKKQLLVNSISICSLIADANSLFSAYRSPPVSTAGDKCL